MGSAWRTNSKQVPYISIVSIVTAGHFPLFCVIDSFVICYVESFPIKQIKSFITWNRIVLIYSMYVIEYADHQVLAQSYPPQLYARTFGSIVGFKFLSDMILLSITNKVREGHSEEVWFELYF